MESIEDMESRRGEKASIIALPEDNAEADISSSEADDDKSPLELLVEKVDSYIEHSTFGDYGTFIRPFSRKFKQSLRTTFPEDREIYDRVDENERNSLLDAFRLRFSTFLIYFTNSFLFAALTCLLLIGIDDPMPGVAGTIIGWAQMLSARLGVQSDITAGEYFVFLVSTLFVAWFLRHLIRQFFISKIREGVASMAAFVIGRLNGLNAAVTNALDKSDSDRQPRSEWPRKAADWIRVALWYEERYEEVDRYISATAWRVENAFRRIETFFRTLNFSVSIFVLFIVWTAMEVSGSRPVPVLIAIGIYVVYSLVAWSFGVTLGSSRLSATVGNSLWRDVFVEKFSDFDKDKRHVFDRIADRVSNDKTTIIDSSPRIGG